MKSLLQRKEDTLLLTAYASLKHNGEDTALENIRAEAARIERIAEEFYKDALDQEYNSFIIDWVKTNLEEIVYGDEYLYDANIPDDQWETNPNIYCREKQRRPAKAA